MIAWLNSEPLKKKLMIDLHYLRQSYERREIIEILWIHGEKNPSDAMTKEKPCNALHLLSNRLTLVATEQVQDVIIYLSKSKEVSFLLLSALST